MELVDFIINNKKLTSKPIPKSSLSDNKDISLQSISSFIKRYNKDCAIISDATGIVKHKTLIITNNNKSFVIYFDLEKQQFEKYDPSSFSKTDNNNNLYCAIIASVRPVLDFQKTKQLLKKISDEKDSISATKLSELSKHFFGKNITDFNYL